MRARIVIVASVTVVALAAVVTYAGNVTQSTAPAVGPAVCPASSPAPTAGAQAATEAPPASEASLPCFAYGACLSCPDGTAQPCLIVQCGTQRTMRCGACTPNCVPPPG